VTCIAAVETDNGVWMGGDSAATEGDGLLTVTTSKVFRLPGYVIGYTESFRLGQLIRYRLRPPEQRCDDPLEHLATGFVDELRKLITKGGVKGDGPDELDGSLLVAYRGRLYSIESDLAVLAATHPYQAIGCGADLAIGSLASTSGRPDQRIRLALATAARHSTGVAPPFTIINDQE